MLTFCQLVQFINPNNWFVTIDLQDAYFHIPVHQATEMSVVRIKGKSIPILLSPVRPGRGNKVFHKVCGGSYHPATTTGSASVQLPGRLAAVQPLAGIDKARRPPSGDTPAF